MTLRALRNGVLEMERYQYDHADLHAPALAGSL
jgi:hypothetical protein